jgi:hypothetical protein
MTRRLEQRPHWQIALALTTAMRVLDSSAAALFSLFLHPDPKLIQSNTFTSTLPPPTGVHYAWLDVWQRFDTLWYLHIAASGYDRPTTVAFYPLYALLVRGLSIVLSPIAAALLISTVAAFFLFWGFCKLASLDLPAPLVIRGVLLYAVWPASFILFAGYADGLAIALIMWAVYFGRTQKWWPAAVCGGVAGLLRAVGALAFVTLLVIALQNRKWKSWPVLLAGLGAIAYPLWLRFSGRVSLVQAYRDYWHIQTVPPWTTLWHVLATVASRPDVILVTNLVLLVVMCVLAAAAPRKIEYGLYSLIVVAQILMRFKYPLLLATGRYLLPLFPAFLGAANVLETDWLQRRFGKLLLVLLAINLGCLWAFLDWSLFI